MIDLGPEPDWLSSHNGCSFNADPRRSPTGDCGKPPTTHLMLRDDEGFAAACADHSSFALTYLPVLEWHAWGAWCNMPGALWYYSPTADEADSWCALDDGTADRELIGAVEVSA